MNKFKVGDKVKIKFLTYDEMEDTDYVGNWALGVVTSMDDFCGETAKITQAPRVRYPYYLLDIDFGQFCWHPNWLEHVIKKRMTIRDIVKLAKIKIPNEKKKTKKKTTL